VRRKEGLRLLFVIFLGRIDKWKLEMLLVDVQTRFVCVGIIKTERYERVDDFLDKTLINDASVSLILNQSKNRAGKFRLLLLDGNEEVVFPLYQSELEKVGVSVFSSDDHGSCLQCRRDKRLCGPHRVPS
jgi:hypothetical protein